MLLGSFWFGFFFSFGSVGNPQQRCGTHGAKHEINPTKLAQVLHSLLRCSESLQAICLPTSHTSPFPAAIFPKKRLRVMHISQGRLSCVHLSQEGLWNCKSQSSSLRVSASLPAIQLDILGIRSLILELVTSSLLWECHCWTLPS